MKKNFLHIILSLLLTIAVRDYIWYEFLGDDSIAIELETEKQEESKEELRENRSSESRHEFLDGNWIPNPQSFSFQTLASGIISRGNSYHPLATSQGEELVILYCQLRLPC